MNECNEQWFTASILELDGHPQGFIEWTADITQDKYNIILPDGSKVTAKLFMDHQQIFDNGAYTSYLVNRFNEINE